MQVFLPVRKLGGGIRRTSNSFESTEPGNRDPIANASSPKENRQDMYFGDRVTRKVVRPRGTWMQPRDVVSGKRQKLTALEWGYKVRADLRRG